MADHLAFRLTLGGAPNIWHVVNALDGTTAPGLYHPEHPTPISVLDLVPGKDPEGPEAVEQAHKIDALAPLLELVELPGDGIRAVEETAREAIESGYRGALRERRGVRRGEAPYRTADETVATARAIHGATAPAAPLTGNPDNPLAPRVEAEDLPPAPVQTGAETEPEGEQ